MNKRFIIIPAVFLAGLFLLVGAFLTLTQFCVPKYTLLYSLSEHGYQKGQITVDFNEGTSYEDAVTLIESYGLEYKYKELLAEEGKAFSETKFEVFRDMGVFVPEGEEIAWSCTLKKKDIVKMAYPNALVPAADIFNDPAHYQVYSDYPLAGIKKSGITVPFDGELKVTVGYYNTMEVVAEDVIIRIDECKYQTTKEMYSYEANGSYPVSVSVGIEDCLSCSSIDVEPDTAQYFEVTVENNILPDKGTYICTYMAVQENELNNVYESKQFFLYVSE